MKDLLDLSNERLLGIASHLKTEDVHNLVLTKHFFSSLLQNRLYQNSPALLRRAIDTDNFKGFRRIVEEGLDMTMTSGSKYMPSARPILEIYYSQTLHSISTSAGLEWLC
jgi:hypothetical protein